jgi:hypothetical protein
MRLPFESLLYLMARCRWLTISFTLLSLLCDLQALTVYQKVVSTTTDPTPEPAPVEPEPATEEEPEPATIDPVQPEPAPVDAVPVAPTCTPGKQSSYRLFPTPPYRRPPLYIVCFGIPSRQTFAQEDTDPSLAIFLPLSKASCPLMPWYGRTLAPSTCTIDSEDNNLVTCM